MAAAGGERCVCRVDSKLCLRTGRAATGDKFETGGVGNKFFECLLLGRGGSIKTTRLIHTPFRPKGSADYRKLGL